MPERKNDSWNIGISSGISGQKELKEEELDRVLDILAENQVQILDGEDESEDSGSGNRRRADRKKNSGGENGSWNQADPVCLYLKGNR